MLSRVLTLALLIGALLFAANPGAANADSRIALVIGNSRYLNTPALDNPGNDAKDVAAALTSIGFKVELKLDASKREFDQALAQLSRDAKTADAALFYYAGHGMQFQGRNYLMPVDAELRDEVSLRYEMTTVDEVKETLRAAKGVKILVLDSCRDNPLANQLVRSIVVTTRDVPQVQGFAREERANGMVIVYSTQADEVANDGGGRNSPFSMAFLKELREPGLEVGALFRRVESDVFEATRGRQSPELSISMVPEYYMNQTETDQTVWARVRENADAKTLKEFMVRYPHSFYAPDAAARLDLIARHSAGDGSGSRATAEAPEPSARDREDKLASRLAAADTEKARLAEALAKSVQARAAEEEEAKQRAGRQEKDQGEREATLRAEIEHLQAGDAEKKDVLEKALDAERARASSEQKAARETEKAAKDSADANVDVADGRMQQLGRRIAELEAKASEAHAETEREQADNKAAPRLALADPTQSAPATNPAVASTMAPLIRDELRRLGCYAGANLGWDAPAIKLGVAKYVRYANLATEAPAPDQILLDDMKKRRAGLCPPECSAREVPVGGRCVARGCPAGQTLSRKGACVTRAPPAEREAVATRAARAAPAPAAARGGGGRCFSFNGSQYCE